MATDANHDEEMAPPHSAAEPINDLITEDAILDALTDADGTGADPPGSVSLDAEHGMAKPLSMDGGMTLSADAIDTPAELEYTSGPAGDGGDSYQLPDGAPEGASAGVHGSVASLRGDPPDRASVRGSMASLRGDPPTTGDARSVRGSVASLRGDPPTAEDAHSVHGSMASLRRDPPAAEDARSIHGSVASLRDDPPTAGDAHSVRGSMASLRRDPPAAEDARSVRGSVASLRGDPAAPASVRGSTTSVRGAGDKPAAPLNRPPTSRPPMSAAAVRPADSTVRGNKMALKSKKSSVDIQENPLTEDADEEFQGDNIWVIAEKMNQARILRGLELTESHSVETTLLFVGGKQAGKSSLIHKFLDRDEEPKKTLGLEYSYGRKTGKSVLKDVCHIWELGGGTTYTPLLETPLKAERLPSLSILLVVDLTKPQTMWITLETMLKTLREGLESEISSGIGRQMQLQERLRSATELRVPSDHPDSGQLRPFPVPLVLVGGRYDAFQDWDPEKKKLICRSLRYLAHVNGASLYFFSPHDSALVKKTKDLMNQLAFGGPASGYLAQDYNKPLLIPAGTDSLAGILGVGADTGYNTARNTFAAQYPQDAQSAAALPDDPAKDMSYREAEIDQLRSQKDQELERLRMELERRRRWGDEL